MKSSVEDLLGTFETSSEAAAVKVTESGLAGWAQLRALKSRPTGERGSSEELVNVRNGPEWP